MSKRYTLQTATGEDQTFAKKDAAIRAGERIGEAFQVLSPAGNVVHEFDPEPTGFLSEMVPDIDAAEAEEVLEDDRPMTEDEIAELLGEAQAEKEEAVAPEATGEMAFPGNYSIAFIPFAQTLADAMGGLETSVTKPGGLTRVFHFAGSKADVEAFQELLNDSVPATLEALHTWQKENRESRKGLTDMQKFLQHRNFIENRAKTIAEGL